MNDGREAKPCLTCGCRRIFHYQLVAYRRQRKSVEHETPVPCSRWINDELDRCGCLAYEPDPNGYVYFPGNCGIVTVVV